MDTAVDELYWDPFDVEIDADPYGIWKRMRDEAPVYRNERYDLYALSRYDDVMAAHRDPATYSSAHGTVRELMRDQRLDTGLTIVMDPPEHPRLRALVSRAFTPRRVAALEDRIRELCRGFLDEWEDGGTFDLVTQFAAPLPSEVISSLLGVPPSDAPTVRRLIDTVF